MALGPAHVCACPGLTNSVLVTFDVWALLGFCWWFWHGYAFLPGESTRGCTQPMLLAGTCPGVFQATRWSRSRDPRGEVLTERLLKKTSARRHTEIVDMVSKNSTMEVVHLSCATDFEHFETFYFNTSHAPLNHSSLIPWGQRCYSQVVPVEIGSRQASKMKALVVAGWMCP